MVSSTDRGCDETGKPLLCVDDFGTNRKRVCDFLLVLHVHSSLVLSCSVSEIRQLSG